MLKLLQILMLMAFLSHSEYATAQTDSGVVSGFQAFNDLLLPDVDQVTVGLGPSYGPDYLGSDDQEFFPRAVFYVKFSRFLSFENDGASINLLGLKNIQFGPVAHFTGPRREDDNPALTGLGNIDGSLDFGLFAKVVVANRFSARIRYFDDILANDNGTVFEVSLNTLLYQDERWSVALGLTGSYTDSRRAEQFFGISAEQAAASGLPEFSPGASFQDVRGDLGVRYQLNSKWSLNGYVRYARLLGDVTDSPIVDPLGSPNQLTVGTFISRTFEF